MTQMHITQAIGAVVMLKKEFDKLSPEQQKVVLDDSREMQPKLLKSIRDENTKSLASMKQAGLQVVESPKEMVTQFDEVAKAIRPKLEPSVYSHEFRERVEKLVAEYRAGNK
jgi:TRAP-type C4-dicarboxylate transport system substrate-binding protein